MTGPTDRWYIATRYDTVGAAGRSYERTRDFVFSADIDATVSRISLDEVLHVVVVGDRVIDDSDRESLTVAMDGGTMVSLDQDTLHELYARRVSAVASGPGRSEKRTGTAKESPRNT